VERIGAIEVYSVKWVSSGADETYLILFAGEFEIMLPRLELRLLELCGDSENGGRGFQGVVRT
jgi:hypothetical protein